MSDDRTKLRSMADLLRSGATLTSLACPVCSSPLFRLKNGELWCAQCEKKVVVVATRVLQLRRNRQTSFSTPFFGVFTLPQQHFKSSTNPF